MSNTRSCGDDMNDDVRRLDVLRVVGMRNVPVAMSGGYAPCMRRRTGPGMWFHVVVVRYAGRDTVRLCVAYVCMYVCMYATDVCMMVRYVRWLCSYATTTIRPCMQCARFGDSSTMYGGMGRCATMTTNSELDCRARWWCAYVDDDAVLRRCGMYVCTDMTR